MPFAKPSPGVLQGGHPQAQGLVGAWLFLAGHGTRTSDYGPNGMDGALNSAPSWISDTFGPALSFNGTTQYSNLYANVAPASLPPALANLGAANTGYGYGARIKTTASASIGGTAPWSCGNTIIEARTTGAVGAFRGWSFGMEGGKLAVARNNGTTSTGQRIVSTTSINDGVAHAIMASIDVNAVSLYIDGALDATGTFTAGNSATGDMSMATGGANIYCQIGARTTNAGGAANWWADTLDHLMVWNRPPTEADARAHLADYFAAFRQQTRVRRAFASGTQRQYAVSMAA